VTLFFVESAKRQPHWLPVGLQSPITWKRAILVVFITVLACLLHCAVLFWYDSRPAPEAVSEATPLPMIDIALEAPNAGTDAEIKPEIAKPTPPNPKVKPAKKPKPKPIKPKAESEIKRPVPKEAAQSEEAENKPSATAVKDLSNKPPVVGSKADSKSDKSQLSKVSAARGYAGYLNNPKPKYPGIARSRNWEGLVLLRVYVTPDGLCGNLNLYRSSGHNVLDESAMAAVKHWKFIPGKRGGTPIGSWVTVPIEFNLRN
jgi:periplasmic protein TonB